MTRSPLSGIFPFPSWLTSSRLVRANRAEQPQQEMARRQIIRHDLIMVDLK